MAMKKPNEIVSIDMGKGFIKIIKARQKENKLHITDFYIQRTPKKKEEIIDQTKSALSDMIKSSESTSFNTTISGDKASLRRVSVPSVPKKELDPLIQSTISKTVGCSLDEIKFRYYILGETIEKGAKKLDVLFSVAKKDTLEEYLNFFKTIIEVTPVVVSPVSASLLQLIKDEDATSIIVVHIGHTTTEIIIFRELKILFSRNIPFGTEDLMDVLLDLKVPPQQAEEIIMEGNIEENVLNNFPQARDVLLSEIESLFKELTLTLSYYSQISYKGKIEKCILSGGGARNRLLREFLSKMCDMPVEEIRLPKDTVVLELSSEKEKEFVDKFPVLSECLGCLLNPGEINFLSSPKKNALQAHSSLYSFISYGILGLFVVFAITGYSSLMAKNKSCRKKLLQVKRQWESLEEESKKTRPLRQALSILKFKVDILKELIENNPSYSFAIVQIVEANLEKSIFLEELKIYRREEQIKLKLSGVSFDEQAPLRFMLNLEKLFRKLSITTEPQGGILSPQPIASNAVNFTIEGSLN